jgi:hypothetical protein
LRLPIHPAARTVGAAPAAPTAVTSITSDAAATVSFLPPTDVGGGPITGYTVTPYIGATPQTPTTVAVGSTTTIVASNGGTYRKVNVSGLTNSTAYTFTVKATNAYGSSAESVASGANTPLSGLVFGDDFNGSADGPIDPEWWIYNRCGYLAQNEVQYYLPEQVRLDGSGRLQLTATHTSYTGPRYPSAGGGSVTQPWRSGAVQNNTRLFFPSAGNTLTVEVGWQVMADAGNGFWPAPWMEGQSGLDTWKTDPDQGGWNDTDHAEIDIAEWVPGQVSGPNNYLVNTWNSSSPDTGNITSSGLATSIHKYTSRWKPGVSSRFYQDDVLTHTSATGNVPASGAQFFFMLYIQMLAGGPTTTESCYCDYVRIYDQNLG